MLALLPREDLLHRLILLLLFKLIDFGSDEFLKVCVFHRKPAVPKKVEAVRTAKWKQIALTFQVTKVDYCIHKNLFVPNWVAQRPKFHSRHIKGALSS